MVTIRPESGTKAECAGNRVFDSDGFAHLVRQYPDDIELSLDVADALRTLRIRSAVSEYELAHSVTLPERSPGTAAEQLAEAVPEIDWIVDDLFPAGICQVNAQQKSGKTTLALNLARSLLTGDPFLRRFAVNFAPDEAIGYLNLELDKSMFLRWVAELGMETTELKRMHIYHAREPGFGRPDFKNSRQLSWFLDWLAEEHITFLVVDTLSKLYDPQQWGGGSDPNIAYNRFWQSMESLKREARLRGVLILHHTGYSEDGAQRARGASAMMDNPDVNLTYRHSGSQGGSAPDAKRYLSANGRIDQVPEFEIDFDVHCRQLQVTTSGMKREDASRRRLAITVWEYLDKQRVAGVPEVAKTKLLTNLQLPTNGNGLSRTSEPILDQAVSYGWVLCRKKGNSKMFSVSGTDSPPVGERNLP